MRVVCNYMGGGFGAKNGPGDYTYIAIALAGKTGRPVRCALTRREENLATGNRNGTIQKLRAGARSDGTLVALEAEYVNTIGWSGFSGPTYGPIEMLYACENVRTQTYGTKLNLPPNAAFRAPGFVEGTFGLECVLDELAARLELDPLELRRRNHADNDLADGRPYSSKKLLECYDRADEHWARREEVRARSEGPVRRGTGLASQIWYGGGGPPSYAWVRVGSDGNAVVLTAMQDIGTGTRTAMAQIAAEELGLPLERVRCELGDSARGPYASISAGSSTTPSMGPAVRAAAADAARQIVEIAAQRHDVEERVLSLKDGKIVSADGGSWPLEEVTGLLEDAQILGKGSRGPNPTGMRVLTFGVQVADVAIDIETGEVRVERIAAIHDVGRVINPLGAQSQVEGGIIQGVGHTLSEERLVDPASGRVLTQTLDTYKLPTIADVPEMVVELLDIPDEHLTNLGSKGLGEPPIVPTAAAIVNAIRDATGADVRSLPVTREEMLRALAEAREREKACSCSSLSRSTPPRRRSATARSRSRAGPSSCRCCARVSWRRTRWSTSAASSREACRARQSVRARHWPSSKPIPRFRLRCARPAHWPPRRSSARWGRSAETCCRRRAAGTGGSTTRVSCTAARSATHAKARIESTPSSATSTARRRTRPTRPPRCSRSGRRFGPTGASCRSPISTGCRRRTTAA